MPPAASARFQRAHGSSSWLVLSMNCHCQGFFAHIAWHFSDARIWDAVKFTCTIGVGRARTTEVCRAVQDYLGEEVQPARIRLVLEAHGIVKKSSL